MAGAVRSALLQNQTFNPISAINTPHQTVRHNFTSRHTSRFGRRCNRGTVLELRTLMNALCAVRIESYLAARKTLLTVASLQSARASSAANVGTCVDQPAPRAYRRNAFLRIRIIHQTAPCDNAIICTDLRSSNELGSSYICQSQHCHNHSGEWHYLKAAGPIYQRFLAIVARGAKNRINCPEHTGSFFSGKTKHPAPLPVSRIEANPPPCHFLSGVPISSHYCVKYVSETTQLPSIGAHDKAAFSWDQRLVGAFLFCLQAHRLGRSCRRKE